MVLGLAVGSQLAANISFLGHGVSQLTLLRGVGFVVSGGAEFLHSMQAQIPRGETYWLETGKLTKNRACHIF